MVGPRSGIGSIDAFRNSPPRLPSSSGRIPVIRAREGSDISGIGGPVIASAYTANGVHFDGSTFLTNNSLVFSDSDYFSCSLWFKSLAANGTIYVDDPDIWYETLMQTNNGFAGGMSVAMGDNGSNTVHLEQNTIVPS